MASLAYGPEERPTGTVLLLSSLQWFIFSLANMVTVPLVLGQAFELTAHQIALYTDRTFFLCGLVGVLQVILGHRYPIIEGPAGMWWGVFLILIQMTKDIGGSLPELMQELEFGLLSAGAFYILLAALGWIQTIRRLFTPIVTGTFLTLLSLQLSKSMVSGLLGVGFNGSQSVVPTISFLSIALVSLTIGLMTRGKGLVKNLAVLISLGVGWAVYGLLGLLPTPPATTQLLAWPALFPWGMPKWNLGILVTSIFTAIILLSNLIASIQALGGVIEEHPIGQRFNRGAFISGIGTALAGLFGTVGVVPLTAAASLVSLTGIASRLPFLIGSAAVAILGLFPKVGQLVATLPAPVGYAVLFTVFGQLLGFGLRDFQKLKFDQRDVFVVSLSLLAGVGIFFTTGQEWAGIPQLVGYLMGNGLIVGVVLVMLFEHVIFRQKNTRSESQSPS